MHIFLKKIAVPIIIFGEWMPHWMPLKKPTRWVSEGCPLSTEWEVIERGFGGCARARGRIWRVSPGRVPPSKATLSNYNLICHGTSLKKAYATVGLEPGSPVSVNRHAMLSTIIHPRIACLLTETGDAGSSPHMAQGFFQWCSMTNNALNIINI